MKKYFYIVAAFLSLYNSLSGAQWQSLGSGIVGANRTILALSAVDSNVVWAIAVPTGFTTSFDFTVTTDGGTNWSAGKLPDTIGNYYPLSIYAINAQVAWASLIRLPNQDKVRMFKTIDGGLNWVEQYGEFNNPHFGFGSIHFFNASEGICMGSCGTGNSSFDSLRIFRTANGGDTWTLIPSGTLPAALPGEGQWVYGNSRYENYGDTLWFGTRASRVFRTTDKGQTWQAFNTGITGNSGYPGLASIAFQRHLVGIATTYLPFTAARTTDGGVTWDTIPVPATVLGGNIEYVPGTKGTYLVNEGFIGGGPTTDFLITKDGGNNWDFYTDSLPIRVIQFLSPTIGFGGGKLTSSTVGGIYKFTGDLSDSTVVNSISPIATGTGLALYPNPAASRVCVITGKAATGGRLVITNILGSFVSHTRLVIILGSVVYEKESITEKEIVSVAGFSRGLYLVSVQGAGKTEVRKLVVE